MEEPERLRWRRYPGGTASTAPAPVWIAPAGDAWRAAANGAVATGAACRTPGCRATADATTTAPPLRGDRPLPVERDAASGAGRHRAQRLADEEEHRAEQRGREREHDQPSAVRPGARTSPAAASRAIGAHDPRPDDPAVAELDHALEPCGDVCVVRRDDEREAERGRCSSSIRSSTRADVSASRWPVGSSQSSRAAPCASARAIATRWASPPESSEGRWSAFASSPTSVEQRERAAARIALAQPGRVCGEGEVLERGERRKQVRALEDVGDPSCARRARARLRRASRAARPPRGRARGRLDETSEGVQQRRLARARRPPQRDRLAGVDRDVTPSSACTTVSRRRAVRDGQLPAREQGDVGGGRPGRRVRVHEDSLGRDP